MSLFSVEINKYISKSETGEERGREKGRWRREEGEKGKEENTFG